KKKHLSEVLNGAKDKFVADAIDIVNKRDYLPINVKGDEQTSATPDEAKKEMGIGGRRWVLEVGDDKL
ncbi:hypothetical protein Tco_1573613, partial [Tanacetum coccineum]